MDNPASPDQRANRAVAAGRPREPDEPRLVEIIDDDPMLGAALSNGLAAHGYRTTFASSADAGWSMAHELAPDLILCDINMPQKNGHWLLQELRRDEVLADCPFILMTGNPAFAQPRIGMDLGADDFLLKPFSLETLVSCVDARLRRREIIGRGERDLVNHLKESLRRNLPHEFFTPLTGIIGYAELLDEDPDAMNPAEQKEAIRGILRSGMRLRRTLRNYLYTLDRLAPDSKTPFALVSAKGVAQLIQQGAETSARRHERRGDLHLEIQPERLEGGAQEIALLVEELVDNAFSFSHAGSPVGLRARRVGREYLIEIRDHGRGMTRQQIRELGLFRQFERHKHEQQGLGVGIHVVQQVLRRLGGQLQIESGKGSGTICHVTLPLPVETEGTL